METSANKNNVSCECPTCHGKKYILIIRERICDECAGIGRDLREKLYAIPCRKCNGKCRIVYSERKTCNTCRGLGKIL